MKHIKKYKIYFYSALFLFCFISIIFSAPIAFTEDKNEIIINADNLKFYDDGNKVTASGNISVQSNDFLSSSDKFTYNKIKGEISATGNIIIKDKLESYYYFDRFISDKDFNNSIGINPKIRLHSGARIVGSLFTRKNSSINKIENASYTPCLQKNYVLQNCPGWKLNAKKVIHDTEKKNIYYEGAILSILNVPIFYTPFFSHPDPTVNKRTGLLMPVLSSNNVLGTSISIPFFYNISSSYDITLTPNIQSKSDDYYKVNYRHLTKNHKFNLDTSISDNESNTGTKNHIFINGSLNNPFGKFEYKVETSNNDTYLRKNNIYDQTILTSSLNFSKEMGNTYLDFKTYIYKHLNNSTEQKWEYIYPIINYDIYKYKDPIYGLNWRIENSLLNYRDINKNFNQQISSEALSKKIIVSQKTGLKFENTIQNRLIYFNSGINNLSQLRIFPQISSKMSYALSKNIGSKTELLEPIIMPILAPHNNYNNDQSISNSNIFELNRETSLSQWESGPRVNYGINWLINNNSYTINTSLGQSAKINKNNNPNNSNEISNYFIGNTFDFMDIGYIKTDITIDRKDFYLIDNNINSSIKLGKIKFGFDYDYETLDKIKTSEQISVGAKIDLFKDTNLIMSVRKDLMSEKSIGNAFGVHYENDCLAINFDYFRDFTAIDDIKNSRGFSFTITLKPFGSSKQAGKIRNFGPNL
tara:strand:- start:1798 stop:3894 length:2097 start_codon:yes stop_codon:yes gene_type:complete